MTDLKPCPYCDNNKPVPDGVPGNAIWIECPACESRSSIIRVIDGVHASRLQSLAIKAWNTRAIGWVGIDRHLPEKDKRILCHCNEDYEQVCRYSHTDEYGDDELAHIFVNDSGGFVSVTHWMPLPEPPDGC